MLSWLDPWWLAALPVGLALAWRLIHTLRARRYEAALWLSAAAAFAPVSQVFPFLTPVADRYLYCILPGLIGGVLLFVGTSTQGLVSSRAPIRLVTLAAPAALMLWLGWQTAERAAMWQLETRLFLDAARHYPDGATAHIIATVRASSRSCVVQNSHGRSTTK